MTIGDAVKAEMRRLNLNLVDMIKLDDGRLIVSETNPILNEPIGTHTFQLLNRRDGEGETVRIDSPVHFGVGEN